MKIAIDIREAARSKRTGKGWYAFQMVKHLLELNKGNSSMFYVLYTDQSYPDFEQYKNVKVKYFPPSTLGWHLKVLRDMKKERPDIYFAPSSFIVPALAPKWLKVVITVHDLVAWLFPGNHNMKATFIERLTLPRALKMGAYVTTVSRNTKKDLIQIFKTKSENIEVIPCAASENFTPLPPQEIQKFRHEKKLPEKYILAVGTLEPRKNMKTLIKCMSQIPADISLYIIGGKGWQYEEIFDEVRKNNLEDRVIFLGYVEEGELPLYYNAASCFVFPSLYEGFGIPPLEAMQCGCPVVCSNTSSLPEVVGESALLVDPLSSNDMSKAIHSVLSDEKLAANLREKGLIQASKFSWEKSAIGLNRMFCRIVR
ncbi:MAG: glycosyltransferase family 1 protein [Candidatus Peregrinibacteria bacterium]|nr:glycosyltransferase family 1 protein [Candidatus Peregrinibacteria bacterium]